VYGGIDVHDDDNDNTMTCVCVCVCVCRGVSVGDRTAARVVHIHSSKMKMKMKRSQRGGVVSIRFCADVTHEEEEEKKIGKKGEVTTPLQFSLPLPHLPLCALASPKHKTHPPRLLSLVCISFAPKTETLVFFSSSSSSLQPEDG